MTVTPVLDADHARMCYHIARYMGEAYCVNLAQTQRIDGDVLVTRHARTNTLWILTAGNQLAMRVVDPRTGRRCWRTEETMQ